MLTHGSLFSGAGLMDMGLEQAGFKTIWRIELMNGKDITKEHPSKYARPFILSGGPPCQNVSQAAYFHRSATGASLWPRMLRFVDALRPAWVLVEQPKGGRNIIVGATQDLQQLGYGCAARVVNSQHWVPQRRERWYLAARLGVDGMALWNHLYAHSNRMEGGKSRCRAHGEGKSAEESSGDRRVYKPGVLFNGSCSDCLRDGVFARIAARRVACVGAGNGVTVPVAAWLGQKIIEAEKNLVR